MKIHIANPYQSFAMLRLAGPLVNELPRLHEVTTGETIDPSADVNIHVPFHTLVEDREYGNGKHIAVYTHCNPGAEPELIKACQRADLVTAMSFTGRQELLNFGVDPKKIWVIPCAADTFQYRPRRVLIVGTLQPNGRKRESILLDLAFQYDLTPYEFILVGGGWDSLAVKLAGIGVKGEIVQAVEDTRLANLYQTADVLLVTGYLEGGPLPLLEAMASGLKVLSPRFGYASDYLSDTELYDGPAELMRKLHALSAHSIYNHLIAHSWSWRDYAAEYALIIGRLTNTSVDLYPERGMSRYTQLLDIIEREKPHSICEIGTWNGNTAIRMLQAAGKFHESKRLNYQGFDLFEGQTGEQFVRELSKVGQPLDVVRKRIEATGAKVELIAGDTRETLNWNVGFIKDFVFVDGGHSEDTIRNDGGVALQLLELHKNTIIVFDDYYHEGQPDGVGCNKFIDNLELDKYEVTHLPVRTRAEDGRLIGMVQVKGNADLRIPLSTGTPAGNYTVSYTIGNGKDLPEMRK